MSFHLESLNFLPGLQRLDGTWIGPMWYNYAKLVVKIASYLHKGTLGIVESSSSRFVDLKPMGFQKDSLACHDCIFF
jgi:hypothetical protein